jgi:hypothetical protein
MVQNKEQGYTLAGVENYLTNVSLRYKTTNKKIMPLFSIKI